MTDVAHALWTVFAEALLPAGAIFASVLLAVKLQRNEFDRQRDLAATDAIERRGEVEQALRREIIGPTNQALMKMYFTRGTQFAERTKLLGEEIPRAGALWAQLPDALPLRDAAMEVVMAVDRFRSPENTNPNPAVMGPVFTAQRVLGEWAAGPIERTSTEDALMGLRAIKFSLDAMDLQGPAETDRPVNPST